MIKITYSVALGYYRNSRNPCKIKKSKYYQIITKNDIVGQF